MPTTLPFTDRHDAGRQLGAALADLDARRPLVVVGIPRGGVSVAFRVAEALDAPLDIIAVRKLGVPGSPEVAMGAIASGGVHVFNDDVLRTARVTPSALHEVIAHEERELLRREVTYRGHLDPLPVAGRTVVLVDDGAATGATVHAAIAALRTQAPRAIIVALPVASREAAAQLAELADECRFLVTPPSFASVGEWYTEFLDCSDAEVRLLMAMARRPREASRRGSGALGRAGALAVTRH